MLVAKPSTVTATTLSFWQRRHGVARHYTTHDREKPLHCLHYSRLLRAIKTTVNLPSLPPSASEQSHFGSLFSRTRTSFLRN
ncbi:hypothetical protein DEO72_LG9g1982 [Vigna unguiculata]|uniref:Uncharacterized protein n=1 Tax=Vigna unguiculata TaxID=3917 RepID=A0A4D6MZQ3_VIGUN|nr:hypothetical protein DEO72_LG9g1980 [Vigna unguiculata]QCE06966.1 hypothetical protein DEO72_LG9g1981 [Vigna unguiculata]QCE06967.1 hypothetical protein DEO72_LG9g1982 [Vigna unguiculata]